MYYVESLIPCNLYICYPLGIFNEMFTRFPKKKKKKIRHPSILDANWFYNQRPDPTYIECTS
jgi:hypothetical protein